MLKLRTVFPFGLNDRIGDENRNKTGVSMIASWFPPLKQSVPTRGLACRRPTNMVFSIDADDLYNRLKITLVDNLPNAINFIRITLSSMEKSFLGRCIPSSMMNHHLRQMPLSLHSGIKQL